MMFSIQFENKELKWNQMLNIFQIYFNFERIEADASQFNRPTDNMQNFAI